MKRNVYVIIGLGLAAVLILALLALPKSVTDSMRKQTLEIFGPLLATAEKPIGFFHDLNKKTQTLDSAQIELKTLHQQVDELQLRNQLLQDKATENARLREMLGFQAASPYELLPCRVVSREPNAWWDSVQINVGWSVNEALEKKYHGKYSLSPDQPVVSPRGVVGKTGTVSQYVTDVILLVNKNCNISATVEGTRDQGIVMGQGNFDEVKPRVLINYLPKDSQVAVHQFVVTSGLGPYFPAGLRLGEVVDVPALTKTYEGGFGLYRQATIEPTANLNQLDELFIVLGPKQGEAPSH